MARRAGRNTSEASSSIIPGSKINAMFISNRWILGSVIVSYFKEMIELIFGFDNIFRFAFFSVLGFLIGYNDACGLIAGY